MKLFISYSRDDSGWTYEFWRKLRDETNHDAWIDQRIIPASDWWHSILQGIESCDCFVSVLSPKSTESIYCREELQYAVTLNKPVLPLLLKECNLPQVLKSSRIQFQDITANPPLDRVLIKVLQSLNYVELAHQRGEYPAKMASRPLEPKPEFDPTETIQIAEDAAQRENYSLAESLLMQVVNSDKGVLGEACKERLDELHKEKERATEYRKIQTLAANKATLKTAHKAWERFNVKFGSGYDPEGIENLLSGHNVTSSTSEKTSFVHQYAPKLSEAARNSSVSAPEDSFTGIFEQFFGKSNDINDDQVNVNISLLEAYQGTTRNVTVKEKTFRFNIPPGVDQGTKIRLSKVNTELKKDIYVTVNIDPHDVFVRDKDNLYSRIRIDDETAQTGGEIKVETLSRYIMLKVPPFTKSGKKFRIAGKGMPIRSKTNEFGDLIVELVYGNSLPFTISVETLGGVATPIIARDTILPAKLVQVYSTAADNQPQVEIHLCYGERPMAADNTSLGKYIFDYIQPAKRGIPQIELLMEIDSSYVLTITATDKGTGRKQTFPSVNLTEKLPLNPTSHNPIPDD